MTKTLSVKKSFGQHFLQDTAIAHRITELLTPAGLARTVLEVGAGTGSLTEALIKQSIAKLYLIEVDHDLIPHLKEKYTSKSTIIAADFLKLPLEAWFQGEPLTIVGNFPYYISSSIFFKILTNRHLVSEVVGMVQQEVAQRLAAPPGNKQYGILSVLLQAFYHITYCFTVPPHAFFPPPKVNSAVITMQRNDLKQLPCNERLFFKILKSAFHQRRKKLRNALAGFSIATHTCKALLEQRGEALTVNEFIQLTHALEGKINCPI